MGTYRLVASICMAPISSWRLRLWQRGDHGASREAGDRLPFQIETVQKCKAAGPDAGDTRRLDSCGPRFRRNRRSPSTGGLEPETPGDRLAALGGSQSWRNRFGLTAAG